MKTKPNTRSTPRTLCQAIASITMIAASSALIADGKSENFAIEEVVVTATKKANAEALQDIPIAVTAFSGEQLAKQHVRDIEGLSYKIPNATLDEVGTVKGIANFSIRGQGINSSISSIDPTVGVFIDGVYMGTIGGVVLDQFDIASIEVLRGPQGVLFGRNVTAGAVVINTTNPTNEFEGSVRTVVETGLNKYVMGKISGPLIEDKLLAKLAIYYNEDDGYFTNEFNGNDDLGASKTSLVRTAITFIPNDSSELMLKYEHGQSKGGGVVSQNRALFEHDSHKVSFDEEGFYDYSWDFLNATYTMDLGSGVLTNIIGWRALEEEAKIDVDGTPLNGFVSPSHTHSEQFSEELRYAITLQNSIDITAGLYYFTQQIDRVEQRLIFDDLYDLIGGGQMSQSTAGAFTAADWRLSDALTLNMGIRYTYEEKDLKSVTINGNSEDGTCNLANNTCSNHDYIDDHSWSNVTPKIGLQWYANDDTRLYASYSKGFRSGGYSLRNTTSTPSAAGPFDEEEMDSFEVGMKLDAYDGRARLNMAAFYNSISDMQREVGVPDAAAGTVQTIENTADATITGFELELTALLTEQLTFGLTLGVLDGSYDKLKYDISGDGVVNDEDKKLTLPRLAPLAGGVNMAWEDNIFGDHSFVAQISYNHRDDSASSDNNTGQLPGANIIDASIAFTTADESLTFSIFGKNLRNEVTLGLDFVLGTNEFFGYQEGGQLATLSNLKKGRVIGAEVAYRF